jgi:multiple sugar transport system permease protein
MLLIPTYQVALWLHLLNSYQALIIPGLYSAFGIFMLRQSSGSVPNELLDAARIDGAAEPRIFVQIVLPLVKPALAALAILQFLASWDNFTWPLVVLTRESLFTLPIGLALFAGEFDPGSAYRNAGAFITVFPLLLMFAIFQRQIIRGIALSGMKV